MSETNDAMDKNGTKEKYACQLIHKMKLAKRLGLMVVYEYVRVRGTDKITCAISFFFSVPLLLLLLNWIPSE